MAFKDDITEDETQEEQTMTSDNEVEPAKVEGEQEASEPEEEPVKEAADEPEPEEQEKEVTPASVEDSESEDEPEEEAPEPVNDYGIYAIRTTANKERNVASKIYDRIERDHYDISAIVVPGLKGYLFVEGSRKDIDKAYRGVAHARGLVAGKTNLGEIGHFLAPKPAVTALAVDYIVEVTAGPFKGEKAKVTRVDNTKNEVTIELLEATVPIPITVPAESVHVIEKGEEKKEKKGKDGSDEPETENPFEL